MLFITIVTTCQYRQSSWVRLFFFSKQKEIINLFKGLQKLRCSLLRGLGGFVFSSVWLFGVSADWWWGFVQRVWGSFGFLDVLRWVPMGFLVFSWLLAYQKEWMESRIWRRYGILSWLWDLHLELDEVNVRCTTSVPPNKKKS